MTQHWIFHLERYGKNKLLKYLEQEGLNRREEIIE
jgi:hypothetical protein